MAIRIARQLDVHETTVAKVIERYRDQRIGQRESKWWVQKFMDWEDAMRAANEPAEPADERDAGRKHA